MWVLFVFYIQHGDRGQGQNGQTVLGKEIQRSIDDVGVVIPAKEVGGPLAPAPRLT